MECSGSATTLARTRDRGYILPTAAPSAADISQTPDELYSNHGNYLSEVLKVVKNNLKAGYLTWRDALATIRDAAKSGVDK
jgi:hypothetical protein